MCAGGLFDDDDEDWMTGSTASKSHSQSNKKSHPSIAPSSKGLFSELGGSEEEEDGLFADTSTTTPVPEGSGKFKVQ